MRVVDNYGEIEVMSTTETITIAYNVVINAGEHMNWILTPENRKDFILEGAGEITIPFQYQRTNNLLLIYHLDNPILSYVPVESSYKSKSLYQLLYLPHK